MERKIRIVMGKPGLDGHDRGIKVLASSYRDAGNGNVYRFLQRHGIIRIFYTIRH